MHWVIQFHWCWKNELWINVNVSCKYVASWKGWCSACVSYYYFQLATQSCALLHWWLPVHRHTPWINHCSGHACPPCYYVSIKEIGNAVRKRQCCMGKRRADEWLNVCEAPKYGPTSAFSKLHNMEYLVLYSMMIAYLSYIFLAVLQCIVTGLQIAVGLL